ncbi:TlpA family protein disulfide reductase [Nannocystis bainbridge]|uniref:TlpA disulfide reductase family protein n=1 Tax=Nannocystis bainbridge TaxID=2995303 RepID=A0ABT5EBZ9_9BACT|nr:TlpA disulfide reductase family protein [Nannocystis bainbridge]MDC0722387.1 TlpA disulfide reductase family protein [Nannocystis bainbridge]
MSLSSRVLLLAAVAAAACTRPQTGPPPEPPPPDAPVQPTQAIRHAAGEVLDVTVPLLAGPALPLPSLRGRVVVLELTSAALPSWPASFAAYNDLLREYGPARLAVVVVALDFDRSALSPEPDLRLHGFELGWDPQGALAARLQLGALPTALVLGRDGRIVHVASGPEPSRTLADAVRAALGP